MKEITLSTGQVAQLRERDELTEGTIRKVEIARSRWRAVFSRYAKPIYLTPEGEQTFDTAKANVKGGRPVRATRNDTELESIPVEVSDSLSDDEWSSINGLDDAMIVAMAISLGGSPISSPADLVGSVHTELSVACTTAYLGINQETEGVDDKINPLAEAAESTASSSPEGNPT